MWSGWYDIFLQGQLIGFDVYQQLADPSVRGKNMLVVGTNGHCVTASASFPGADGDTALASEESIRLFAGNPVKPEGAKAITFFIMGADEKGAPGNYWTT
jgi:hypothetical protein